MNKEDIIKKWLDNIPLNDKELEIFKNLDSYDSYIKISDTAKKIVLPNYDIESNLHDLKVALLNRKKVSFLKPHIHILMRIAAIFVIGLGLYFTAFYTSKTTIDTLASQKKTIELPDHTFVRLNSLSSIEYKDKDWENNRNIKLNGEAYFKVAKGKKFNVYTSSGLITVLGTEFNVNQRDNYFEVICYEGLVSVTHQKKTIKLSAGKTFKILKNETYRGETNIKQPDWIKNKSVFTSTPYFYILKEFERQYNVTIITDKVDLNKLFTGNFVHSDINTAIQSITIPMRLKYNINKDNITLYKE